MPSHTHRLGPKRDASLDSQITAAVREELVERGYAGLTIERVAARAGVSRPAVYRRWNSKAELVADSVFVDLHDGGEDHDVAQVVAQIIRGCIELFGSPAGRMAVPGLIADVQSDPRLYPQMAAFMDGPVRARLRRQMETRGDLTLDPDIVVDAIAGAVIIAVCVRQDVDVEALERNIFRLVLDGVAH